jgi:hypothetical protein
MRQEPALDFSQFRHQVELLNINIARSEFGDYNDFWKCVEYMNAQTSKMTSREEGYLFLNSHDLPHLQEVNDQFELHKNSSDLCEMIHKGVGSDLFLTNVGSYTWKNKRPVVGPLDIDEFYFADSLATQPNILPALVFHVFYWNDQFMICLASNRWSIGTSYSEAYGNRVEELIQQFSQ